MDRYAAQNAKSLTGCEVWHWGIKRSTRAIWTASQGYRGFRFSVRGPP